MLTHNWSIHLLPAQWLMALAISTGYCAYLSAFCETDKAGRMLAWRSGRRRSGDQGWRTLDKASTRLATRRRGERSSWDASIALGWRPSPVHSPLMPSSVIFLCGRKTNLFSSHPNHNPDCDPPRRRWPNGSMCQRRLLMQLKTSARAPSLSPIALQPTLS
jgi:hypothetical protein